MDYDDTLAAAGRPIDPVLSQALVVLRRTRLLILATERAGWAVPDLVDELLFDWAVVDGGARVRRQGQDVIFEEIPRQSLAALLDDPGRPAAAASTADGFVYEDRYPVVAPPPGARTTPNLLGEQPRVLRLFLWVATATYRLPAGLDEELVMVPSVWPGVVVVRARRASKAVQVKDLLGSLGIARSAVTVFGNSPQDDEILQWASSSYVVGRAPTWPPSACQQVTHLPGYEAAREVLRAFGVQ